jgi:hypothetical protein
MSNPKNPYIPETNNPVIMTGRNYNDKIVNFILKDLVCIDPCHPQTLYGRRIPDTLIPTLDQAHQIYKVYPEMTSFWASGYFDKKGLLYVCKDGVFIPSGICPSTSLSSFLYTVKEI